MPDQVTMLTPSPAGSGVTEHQDDDFGDFQSASTDPFKQPIYAQHNVDETKSLLNAESDPDIQIGVFQGTGLVEPLRLGLDSSTRWLRHMGKATNWKLHSARARAKNAAKRQEGKLVRDHGGFMLSSSTYGDMRELVDVFTAGEVSSEDMDVPAGVTDIQREGTDEIDRLMEEEKTVWDESAA